MVQVDESGSVGAAATGVRMRTKRSMPSIPTCHCDRPFLWMVIENTTNQILFIGKYARPVGPIEDADIDYHDEF